MSTIKNLEDPAETDKQTENNAQQKVSLTEQELQEKETARNVELDRLRYVNFCKTGKYSIKQILRTQIQERSENERFFLR